MGEIIASIGHGFRNAPRFSGRDTRGQFWPYAIFVFLAASIVSYLALVPELMGSVQRVMQIVEEPPGRELTPEELDAMIIAAMPNFELFMWVSMAVNVVAVLLLAAAVTRRLHDRDRTGLWGLLPLPSFALGFALAPRALDFALRPADDPEAMSQFMLQMLNSMLSWGLLIVLIVLLAGQGSDGANRFGPAPP